MRSASVDTWPIRVSRSGSGYGRGVSSTLSTTLKIAVVAPMPRVSVRMAARLKPGLLASMRTASPASWRNSSHQRHPHTARVSSRTSALLPSRIFAWRAASDVARPRPRFSSVSRSRWKRHSSSSSVSACRPRYGTSRTSQEGHCIRQSPSRTGRMTRAIASTIVPSSWLPASAAYGLYASVRRTWPVGCCPTCPLRADPAPPDEAVERRIE